MGAEFSICSSLPPLNGPFPVRVLRDKKPLGRAKLFIQDEDIYLELLKGDERILQWPIRSIRRYGCEKNCFTFESGRRCNTGPGVFVLEGKHSERILDGLQERVDAIREEDEKMRRENVSRRAFLTAKEEKCVKDHSYVNVGLVPEDRSYVNVDMDGNLKTDHLDGRQSLTGSEGRVEYAELDLKEIVGDLGSDERRHVAGIGKDSRSTKTSGRAADGKTGQMHVGFPDEPQVISPPQVAYVQIDPKMTKIAAEQRKSRLGNL